MENVKMKCDSVRNRARAMRTSTLVSPLSLMIIWLGHKTKKPLHVIQSEEQSESEADIYTSIALFLDFRIGHKTKKAPSLLKGLP